MESDHAKWKLALDSLGWQDSRTSIPALNSLGFKAESWPLTVYITRGWMNNKGVLYNQFLDIMARYGEEDGAEIFEMMAGHYKFYGIPDTHCYDMTDVIANTERMASEMGMECFVAEASDSYLRDLLNGPYDDSSRFVRVAPGEPIRTEMLNS